MIPNEMIPNEMIPSEMIIRINDYSNHKNIYQ
jgi:hypothetical protein